MSPLKKLSPYLVIGVASLVVFCYNLSTLMYQMYIHSPEFHLKIYIFIARVTKAKLRFFQV